MSARRTEGSWHGSYVRDALAVHIETAPDSLLPVPTLVGLALRRNPKRAHLLVSRVLAKHVPTEPGITTAAGRLLGLLVRAELQADAPGAAGSARGGGTGTAGPLRAAIDHAAAALAGLLAPAPAPSGEAPSPDVDARQQQQTRRARTAAAMDLCDQLEAERAVFTGVATIGYAETATGLGQLVAEQLDSYYIHSTRLAGDSLAPAPYGVFEESHSHATSHRLLPTSHAALDLAGTVVLVDDELSTGETIINTIRELHRKAPHSRYVVASLVDLRSAAARTRLAELAGELGCAVSAVALAHGSIRLPATLAADAAELIRTAPVPEPAVCSIGKIRQLDLNDVVPPVRSGRFGVAGRPDARQAGDIATALAADLGAGAGPGERLLVLATEEFMALPLAVALRLQQLLPGVDVRYSTSTRSPVAAMDEPGYAIRSALSFDSGEGPPDGAGPRFAYNFAHPGGRFDTVVIMAEPGTPVDGLTAPGRIAEAVAGTGSDVRLVLLPRQEQFPAPLAGPGFGSYAASDVQWLLKDLSFARLEAPTAEREAAIQSGKASYAESLPQEYEPSAEYAVLFHQALESSAARLAHAVGALTEQVLRLRGNAPVLVSLARAGTPVGILMKRWARDIHGLDLPHYAVSIVRGLGMDQTALGYLAARHQPEQIMFVDGWTGKGAIARELADAVALFRKTDAASFRPDLAVLADPGHCVRIFGTREDYLVPSACLNSTVSGLVSRTVFNRELISPGDFHGAKFYAHLASSDVSTTFLDAVTAHFPAVRDDVLAAASAAPARVEELPEPDWSGWSAVERISRDFGINNVNLVKPGVGETTRVLLRRVPWKVLVRPDAAADIGHVLHLAHQRGVEVVEVPGLPYSCVGLIHPIHTPGATGADGKSVIDV